MHRVPQLVRLPWAKATWSLCRVSLFFILFLSFSFYYWSCMISLRFSPYFFFLVWPSWPNKQNTKQLCRTTIIATQPGTGLTFVFFWRLALQGQYYIKRAYSTTCMCACVCVFFVNCFLKLRWGGGDKEQKNKIKYASSTTVGPHVLLCMLRMFVLHICTIRECRGFDC
jgi:hypothetical protein